jgi:hypothetical protein
MNTRKSNVKGDIPAKIFKEFSFKLSKPVVDVINSSIKQGLWPHIFKVQIVTPVPKVYRHEIVHIGYADNIPQIKVLRTKSA